LAVLCCEVNSDRHASVHTLESRIKRLTIFDHTKCIINGQSDHGRSDGVLNSTNSNCIQNLKPTVQSFVHSFNDISLFLIFCASRCTYGRLRFKENFPGSSPARDAPDSTLSRDTTTESPPLMHDVAIVILYSGQDNGEGREY